MNILFITTLLCLIHHAFASRKRKIDDVDGQETSKHLQSEDDIANSDEAEAFKEAVNEHHWQEEEACQERERERSIPLYL
jgi:hypothetical protein